ncbi:MAG: tetratricopeptide repeat protein [Nannocystaceae bacterium]|nr:tetratricopeptide repeat protein [Nannocystaceae bacterium]
MVDKLGSGAMGTVYRAYDPELDRGIALKLVEIRRARWKRPAEIRARIMREAQAIARVQHPNVVQVFDVGEVDYAVWVAMEYVDGETIKVWAGQEARRRSWQEVVHAFVCAGEGLAAAHRADIVHRDFKPENVMIGRDGRIRVLDFGLARAMSANSMRDHARIDLENLSDLPAESSALDTSLTARGAVMGTPAYMAPEQHLGKSTGPAADQFAFCVSLWEALYGDRPFRGETHAAVAFAATRGTVTPPPDDHGVPRWIHAAMLRGLRPQPDDRFADMKTLIAALEANPARRTRRIVVGIAFVVSVAGAAMLATALGPGPTEPVCSGATTHLKGIWDDARRASVSRSFAQAKLSFAAESFETTATTLDDWSTAWVTAHTEACRATQVLGEQSAKRLDLRMTCLARHLGKLSALVDVLDAADREVIAGAIDASATLPRVERCSDLEYLTARVLPPSDPEQIQALAELTEALANIGARAHTGAYRDLADRLREIESRVTALDHPPLSSEFFRLRAEVQESTGDARGSRLSQERAFAAALRGGDTRSATLAATKLVYIVGHTLSDHDDGQRWTALARELVRAAPDDGRLQASLWSAEASMYATQGDYNAAVASEQEAIDFWLREAPSSPHLGTSYGNVGNTEVLRGNYDLAAELLRKELDVVRNVYGPHHPVTGGVNSRLASALSHGGHIEESLPLFRAAIAVLRQSEGEGSIRLAAAMDGLGRVFRKQGKLDQAVAQHREALVVWRDALGEEHPDVAVSLMHVGYTLAATEAWQDALDVFDEAAVVFQKSVGDDHPQLIYVANSRANMLLLLERPEEAGPIVEHALSLTSARQADPTLIAETQFILAQALWSQGADRPRAVQLATLARESYAAGPDIWAEDLRKVETWLTTR